MELVRPADVATSFARVLTAVRADQFAITAGQEKLIAAMQATMIRRPGSE